MKKQISLEVMLYYSFFFMFLSLLLFSVSSTLSQKFVKVSYYLAYLKASQLRTVFSLIANSPEGMSITFKNPFWKSGYKVTINSTRLIVEKNETMEYYVFSMNLPEINSTTAYCKKGTCRIEKIKAIYLERTRDGIFLGLG